jgi:hypothetical protein
MSPEAFNPAESSVHPSFHRKCYSLQLIGNPIAKLQPRDWSWLAMTRSERTDPCCPVCRCRRWMRSPNRPPQRRASPASIQYCLPAWQAPQESTPQRPPRRSTQVPSCRPSSRRERPGRWSECIDVGLGPAPRARLDKRLRHVPIRAAGHRRHRPRQRVGRQQVEALSDRVRRIGRRHRH